MHLCRPGTGVVEKAEEGDSKNRKKDVGRHEK